MRRTGVRWVWLVGLVACGGGVGPSVLPPARRVVPVVEPLALLALPAELAGYRPVADGVDANRLLLIGPALPGQNTQGAFWHELALIDLETLEVRRLPPVAAQGRLGGPPVYTVRWFLPFGKPRKPCESVVSSDEQVLVMPFDGLPPPEFAEVVAPPPHAVLLQARPKYKPAPALSWGEE